MTDLEDETNIIKFEKKVEKLKIIEDVYKILNLDDKKNVEFKLEID